jgi:hypothetical protein
MDLDDIQKEIDKVMQEQNNRAIPEFENYSPFEMHNILHFTFENNCPLTIQKISDDDYERIPMLNQIKYFLELIRKSGELKLTTRGFLPTKIVKDIYEQGYLEEYVYFLHTPRVSRESDSMTVNLTRILAELSGLVKKRNGKLSLTKKGEKLYADNPGLFDLVFKTMTRKFNWAYYDGYGDNKIGQLGYGLSLILLSKYGGTKRQDVFYAEKYFKAFPTLIDHNFPSYLHTPEEVSNICYSVRTFDRFMYYFGLVKIERVGDRWNPDIFITKADLFDRLINIQPPSNQNSTVTKRDQSPGGKYKKTKKGESKMTKAIYQIKVTLTRTKPSIWRRLLVPSDMLLSDFHKVIQSSMGWTNSHLHQFISDDTFYCVRMPDDDFWDEMNNVDYEGIRISDLMSELNDVIMYEYDFGDSWEHKIVLEKILQPEENRKYPVCIKGARNCPPEDCGGVWGYEQLIEVLKNPDHEGYKSYIEWLGGEFEPELFDINEVNELLSQKDFGCIDFWS